MNYAKKADRINAKARAEIGPLFAEQAPVMTAAQAEARHRAARARGVYDNGDRSQGWLGALCQLQTWAYRRALAARFDAAALAAVDQGTTSFAHCPDLVCNRYGNELRAVDAAAWRAIFELCHTPATGGPTNDTELWQRVQAALAD